MAGSLQFLSALGAAGGEISGVTARFLWAHLSRSGRLALSLRRLEAAGKIAVQGAGPLDERVIRLTTEARNETMAGIDPPALWARAWDGVWRIVAFDIPESNAALRAKLRRRLHQHRFGWLQNSVWISPDPLGTLAAGLGDRQAVPDSLTLFEAKPVGGESQEALVTSAWDFAALATAHANYLKVLKLRPNRLHGLDAWIGWLDTEHRAWRRIARLDPFLPAQLLPTGYRGREAWEARQIAFAAFSKALH